MEAMEHTDNPYAPPERQVYAHPNEGVLVPEGSFGLGVALGSLLGLWGLIGCLVLGKAETKRGAKYGFLGRIGLVVVLVFVMIVVDAVGR
jgi:hypothetical protein